MDLLSIAERLDTALFVDEHEPITHCHNESPGVLIIADFLLHCALPRTVRTRLSAAETCFILHKFGDFSWPTTYDETRQLLEDLRTFVQKIVVTKTLSKWWYCGFLFFGTSNVITKALEQLQLTRDARPGRMLIGASHSYFNGTKARRTTSHVTYYIFNDGVWTHIRMTTLPHHYHAKVVCAQPGFIMPYTMLPR